MGFMGIKLSTTTAKHEAIHKWLQLLLSMHITWWSQYYFAFMDSMSQEKQYQAKHKFTYYALGQVLQC